MRTRDQIASRLRHNLWQEEAGIMFVGYQARETLGRGIIEGARRIKIFGEGIEVQGQTWAVNGFSAHTDQRIFLDWLGKTRAKISSWSTARRTHSKALQMQFRINSSCGLTLPHGRRQSGANI